MKNQAEITCVGQALVDCITRGKEAQPHKNHVYRADGISLSTGGDALNESAILAGMGYRVRLVCGLGDDLAGQLVLHMADKYGIDISFAEVSPDLSTPIANLMVERDGSRQSINSRTTMLTGYEPDGEAFQGVKIVSFASLFRAPLDQKDVIIRLVRQAKEAGAIICADTKLPTYREISLEDIKEVLPLIDYFFPNENEAAYYSHITDGDFHKMCQVFAGYGIKNIIIKMGEKGCVAMHGDEYFHVPAKQVKAVDSTGAGDNFVAGFIHGLLNDWDLKKCCDYGTECAAASVQHVGAVVKTQYQ